MVLFVDELDQRAETRAGSLESDILIVGRTIVKSGDLFARLQKAGLSKLVVAGVRRPKVQKSPDIQIDPAIEGDEWFSDLSQLGSVTIQLPESP